MTQIAWFERKSDFSFPAGLLPNVYARLRGTPARLEETLRGRAQAILTGSQTESGRCKSTRVTCRTWNSCGWREWKITSGPAVNWLRQT
jgi:hypothetical protein